MTRPTLICAPSRAQAETLAEALGGRVLTPDVAGDLIRSFHSGEVLVLVTYGTGFITGWRAPDNTLVVFLDGFDPRPEVRFQVEARVHRSGLQKKAELGRAYGAGEVMVGRSIGEYPPQV